MPGEVVMAGAGLTSCAAVGLAGVITAGALAGALSMALHRLVAPRERLDAAKRRVLETRRAMNAYDGPAAGLGPLAGAAIGAALRHMGLSLGPALLAAAPTIAGYLWLEHRAPTGECLAWGPAWLRGWQTPFWTAVLFASVAVRRLGRRRA